MTGRATFGDFARAVTWHLDAPARQPPARPLLPPPL